jgi:hypothetical protein
MGERDFPNKREVDELVLFCFSPRFLSKIFSLISERGTSEMNLYLRPNILEKIISRF